MLLFGSGGQLVEVFKDRALALPPLNTTLARRMMEQTKIYTALKGVRGREPVDLRRAGTAAGALQPAGGRAALDQGNRHQSAAGLAGAAASRSMRAWCCIGPEVERRRLAAAGHPPVSDAVRRPAGRRRTANVVTIRPIRPEDEPLMVKFHETLSERSVYLRYFQLMNLSQRTAHERLTRICFIDYDREMALVAEHGGEVVAVSRMHKMHSSNAAEFAIVVSDAWHGKGLGLELLRRLLDVARQEGVGRIVADIHVENSVMQKMCQRLGFRMMREAGDPTMHAELDL